MHIACFNCTYTIHTYAFIHIQFTYALMHRVILGIESIAKVWNRKDARYARTERKCQSKSC